MNMDEIIEFLKETKESLEEAGLKMKIIREKGEFKGIEIRGDYTLMVIEKDYQYLEYEQGYTKITMETRNEYTINDFEQIAWWLGKFYFDYWGKEEIGLVIFFIDYFIEELYADYP
jgi:adenine-specific DNA methylase